MRERVSGPLLQPPTLRREESSVRGSGVWVERGSRTTRREDVQLDPMGDSGV